MCGLKAPLGSVRVTKGPSEPKVGYGEANVDAFQFAWANDIATNVGFVKLFVSTCYVDMTGLKQESLVYGAREPGDGQVRMIKPPSVDLWDTWTYVLRIADTA